MAADQDHERKVEKGKKPYDKGVTMDSRKRVTRWKKQASVRRRRTQRDRRDHVTACRQNRGRGCGRGIEKKHGRKVNGKRAGEPQRGGAEGGRTGLKAKVYRPLTPRERGPRGHVRRRSGEQRIQLAT